MTLTGTTGDAFEQLFSQSYGGEGLRFWGGIKNTGGSNSMSVRVTATDLWGDTEALTIVVPFGEKLSFDAVMSAYMSAQPPFSTITVEVMSTSAGNSTTYEMHTLLF